MEISLPSKREKSSFAARIIKKGNLLSKILYCGLVIPISSLPFRVLFWLTDFVNILAYYVVGYRKKIVRQNLKNSFPELSEKEIKKIEKWFYKHFADFLVESVKSLTISNKKIIRRCAIIYREVPNKYFEQGLSVMVLCGHYNNWEYYAVGLAQQMKHKVFAAYQPWKNEFLNLGNVSGLI